MKIRKNPEKIWKLETLRKRKSLNDMWEVTDLLCEEVYKFDENPEK